MQIPAASCQRGPVLRPGHIYRYIIISFDVWPGVKTGVLGFLKTDQSVWRSNVLTRCLSCPKKAHKIVL